MPIPTDFRPPIGTRCPRLIMEVFVHKQLRTISKKALAGPPGML